ncbi:MAG: MFS transporter [Actinomycetota bacterium]
MSRLPFRERLGPLVERDYRLFFSATTVTTLGDSVSGIALVFAVLHLTHNNPVDVGIVLGVRTVANTLMVLVGGVISDRLPRNRVLVGASLVQGAAQAATAAVVLSGDATIALLIAIQALYGAADGFVIPAQTGLVPQTVTPARLQQGNALLGLSRNFVFILGPAIGGTIVAVSSPGIALAADAASFVGAALLLARIRIAPREALAGLRFFHELREGWREFTSRTWLWSTVVIFGLGNIFFMFWPVLGPTIERAKHGEHGGAKVWGAILAVNGIGAVIGGLVSLRYKPRLPLVACILWPTLISLQLGALALGLPAWVIAGASFFGGLSIAVHLTLWFTVFQREVPEHAQSRVSSYDSLGSFVLTPLGLVLAGVMAHAIGTSNALWLAAGAILVGNTSMLLIPSVWKICREPPPTTIAA